jgi:pantoate--beta-alanine ligase
MVQDMNMDVEIIRIPIVREPDGLAMSSRNIYLTPEQRKAAPVLYRALEHARKRVDEGERKSKTIVKEMREIIESEKEAKIDYLAVTDLIELKELRTIKGRCLIAAAAFFGTTRLIDNVIVETEA